MKTLTRILLAVALSTVALFGQPSGLPKNNPIFTGTIKGGNGSASAPSYSFTGDPDTGIFWDSTNVIGFSNGGSQSLKLLIVAGDTWLREPTNNATIQLLGAGGISLVANGSNQPITLTSSSGMSQRFRNGFATAGQTPAATTRTYITGSDAGPFTAGQLVVGTMLHWHIDITKTAAGTASSVFDICFGTAGTTSDTARVSFTKPAGVAQADHCSVDIYATVKTNSASGVVVGDFTLLDDQTNALGGFLAAAKWISSITTTSGTFDTTTPTHVGLCVTTGASDAWTINHVQLWTANM